MNDQDLNQRELELATAARLPAGETLATETAELREGWVALMHALPSPGGDDAEFAAPLARELVRASAARCDRRNSNWMTVVAKVSAVAAAALVALGLWLGMRPPSSVDDASTTELAERIALAPAEDPTDDADAWDDPLDAQISDMQDRLAEIAADGPRLDASLSALGQEISELADDLDAGSL